jgi:hypothetical protein
VDDDRERIDLRAGHEDVEPAEVAGAVADDLVIHRAVAPRRALQLIVEVVDHLGQGSSYERIARVGVMYSVFRYVPRRSSQSCMIAPMESAGRMKFTRASGSRNSSISPGSGMRVGLEMCLDLAPLVDDLVGDVGRRLHEREVALALEPLLDDLHVEHPQEARSGSRTRARRRSPART